MQVVIDNRVFVLAFGLCKFDFLLGVCEAELDDFFAIGAATAESAFQFFVARRHDENARCVRIDLVEVHLAENIKVEQNAVPFGESLLDKALGRAIVVAVDFVPFNQAFVLDHLLEFFFCLEEVVDSVDFTFARFACCCRDGILDVREILDDQVLEGGLPCAARGTHNEKLVLHDSNILNGGKIAKVLVFRDRPCLVC